VSGELRPAQERILARAIELDDDLPDHICPGCGQDITGWKRHEAHFVPGSELSEVARRLREVGATLAPWPFTARGGRVDGRACDWTADFLSARRFRRQYIAEHADEMAVAS